jgi:hypothetical protein
VPAKVTKLIGLKRPPFLSPTNLIIFACTQNGEYSIDEIQKGLLPFSCYVKSVYYHYISLVA